MNIVFSASRLMKVSEVRRLCEEMRQRPEVVLATELEAKKRVYERFMKKKKLA
ncbi:hypothetical protein A0O32_2193 [Anoxybacillus flavithermus]|uniref:hypothetical protein n=1 Tax=Anoxybacillus flavithermus TaxID=33934 RepID=UPI0007E00178|nr:hypothetical protein [Anoxybacillus flavithermus]OAO78063.1 hypothetical protein A0O32_2193 [Anoxybacillus flavithermus]